MTTAAISLQKEFLKKRSLQEIATWLVIFGLFLIMLSVSWMDKALLASVALVILQANFRQHLAKYLKNPVVLSAIPLVILFTIRMIYTEGFAHDAFHMWDKYLKIMYPLFFIPLFMNKNARQYALKAFIIGVVIAEAITYLRHFGVVSFGLPPIYHWFVHDIDGSYVIAVACYILMNFILDDKKYRWWYVAAFLFIAVDLFFLNVERTGYLVFTSLAGLFFLQRLGWRGFVIGLLIIPLTLGGLYFGSKKFHDRVDLIFSDIHGYAKGDSTTSIGLRLAFAEYSFKMIKHSPILGSGTGSFKKLYQQLDGPKLGGKTWPGHPHNEYIFIVEQIGIVGLLFFIVWIVCQFWESFYLPDEERRLFQGLLFSFLILSICNSSLALSPGSNLYVILMAVLLGARVLSVEQKDKGSINE